MSVRRRLLALLIAMVVVIGLVVVTMGAATWVSDHALTRTTTVSARLDLLDQIAVEVASYRAVSMQLAAGEADAGDAVSAAKIALERLLARLTQVTRDEIAALDAMDEIQRQLPEIDASRRLLELFHAIDAATNVVRSSLRDGDSAGARQTFAHDVAFRLDNEFAPLLTANSDGERAELSKASEFRDSSVRQILVAGGIASAAAALFSIWAGLALQRSVNDSIRSAAAQAAAAEAGHALELRQANRQLQDLDQRRGQFLADVSHELRTPLTILRGEADVALRGEADADSLRATLERIQGQAGELGLLLDDLLEFARTAQDDHGIESAPCSLVELVTASAQEGEMLAASREMTLTTELPPADVMIDADFRRLKQALVIGLDNAVKQSPPGSAMTLSARVEDGQAVIAIIDNGSGVAEADLPRVFDRFYRGHGADGSMRDGIGIGLAIAKDIVERHGGSIALANRPEGGAILRISLPLQQEAVA